MLLNLLPVNIRFFDEEPPEPQEPDMNSYFESGEFDVDKFRADFESQYKDEPEEEPEEEPAEPEEEPSTEEPEEPEEPEEKPEGKGEDDDTPQFQNEKQNQAFAQMRTQLKEEQKLADFVRQLAEKQGLKPEELMTAFEERQLEQEAKDQNVPVDVLKRLKSLESENQQVREQQVREKFNADVQSVRSKYNLDDTQMDGIFKFIAKNNYVDQNRVPTISFEDAYVLANKDNLITNAKEQGRQEYLEAKKQKQQSATVPTGQAQSPETGGNTDYSVNDIRKQFKEMGLDDPFE